MYLEDAGFDWKILGPDVTKVDYMAWQSDLDAYAATKQKCSAQSSKLKTAGPDATDFGYVAGKILRCFEMLCRCTWRMLDLTGRFWARM